MVVHPVHLTACTLHPAIPFRVFETMRVDGVDHWATRCLC